MRVKPNKKVEPFKSTDSIRMETGGFQFRFIVIKKVTDTETLITEQRLYKPQLLSVKLTGRSSSQKLTSSA